LPTLSQESLIAFEKRDLIAKQRSGGPIGRRFPVACASLACPARSGQALTFPISWRHIPVYAPSLLATEVDTPAKRNLLTEIASELKVAADTVQLVHGTLGVQPSMVFHSQHHAAPKQNDLTSRATRSLSTLPFAQTPPPVKTLDSLEPSTLGRQHLLLTS
jgi:hypothetical protein